MNITNIILNKNNDNYELLELLSLDEENNFTKITENKKDELKNKLENKLEILEKLYQEKYIKLEDNINNKLNFRESILKKYKNEYEESLSYYRNYLDEIRFNQDLVNLNKTHSDLIKELEENNFEKEKLKNIKKLDSFYLECNEDIIFKNENLLYNKMEYNNLKSSFEDEVEEIKNEYQLNKKSLITILNKLENSIKNLNNKLVKDILFKKDELIRLKNKINNQNVDIQNKIQQLKVNNNYDNLKILQNDKYLMDIDLNNKKMTLLEKKYNKDIKLLEDNYLKKKKEIECKIIWNEEKLVNEEICMQNKINKKIKLIKNYEDYFLNLENENKYLLSKNENIQKNIYYLDDTIRSYDIVYIRINNNIKDTLKSKEILTEKLSKKYKYYLNIYEDDLYQKKLKIFNISHTVNKIKKMNINDKDLLYIKNKIIILKKFLKEN